MFRSRGRISGSNLTRVDGPYEHSPISGGVYNSIDNLMMAGRKSGEYLKSLSSRWKKYLEPNSTGGPTDIFFTEDGLKVFVLVYVSSSSSQLETWTMTEPFGEPTYVSKVNISSDANFGDVGQFDFGKFTPDGMYFFSSNIQYDYPQTYSLSSAYDVSDSSLIGMGKDVKMLPFIADDSGSNEQYIRGHEFGNSGLKMYTVGSDLDRIVQYTLSTAYDVTTASYDGYKDVSSISSSPGGITWKPGGSIYYMIDFSSDVIYQVHVSTPWDIVNSTNTVIHTLDISSYESSPFDVRFKTDDGTKMFVIGSDGDGIDTYTLTTGWDISTASHTAFDSLSTENSIPYGLDFSPDGTKMVVAGETDDELLYYTLSTPWDISSKTYQGLYHTSPYGVNSAYYNGGTNYFTKSGFSILKPRGVRYINDGDGISILDGNYLSSSYYAKVVNYTLGQSYNGLSIIDGMLLDYYTQSGASNDNDFDLEFNNNGTKAYVVNSTDDKIYQWTLDIPYTVSSSNYGMTYNGTTAVLGGETNLRAMSFNDVGDRLFITGTVQEKISEFTVSTPFDVTSTVSITTSYSISNQISGINTSITGETSPTKIQWTNSGLFFSGFDLDAVYKINFVDK